LIDKPVGRTPRRGAALIAAVSMTMAVLGSQVAFAQSGGVGAPGGTTTTTDPTTTTTAPTGSMIFPVSGPHTFGEGFGAPRPGRKHLGQDVLSPCGTPLVSISRTKVKWVSYQGAAGNYVVVRNKRVKQDYMYSHLATVLVTKGQVLQPGQQLGTVGRTGNATACLLDFELWLGKWYRGGSPVDPMPYLQTYQGY
jgi:murein DD-endopeptidase MepM/ murein hydrolase activator NlpD